MNSKILGANILEVLNIMLPMFVTTILATGVVVMGVG